MTTTLLLLFAPPSPADLRRFPPAREAAYQRLAYKDYLDGFEARRYLHREWRHQLTEWEWESRRAYDAWDALWDAHEGTPGCHRESRLGHLRDGLGWPAWRDGTMPPRFPHRCKFAEWTHRLRPFTP